MWLLRIVLFVLLLALLVLVALDNDRPVDVKLLGWELLQVRLFLVVYAAALFGLLVGLAMMAIREVQWRMRTKRQRKHQSLLENEVRDLRAAPLHGLEDENSPDTR